MSSNPRVILFSDKSVSFCFPVVNIMIAIKRGLDFKIKWRFVIGQRGVRDLLEDTTLLEERQSTLTFFRPLELLGEMFNQKQTLSKIW